MSVRVLLESSSKNDLDLMDRALSGEFGEVSIERLNEALVRCATLGHTEAVTRLLAHGADIDAEDGDGDTALMMASSTNQTKLVKILIDMGADIDATSDRGRTALHMAVWNNRLMIARMLLKAGINTAVHDIYGDTALMLCARRGYGAILHMLIKGDCDIEANSVEKWNALQYAAQYDHDDCVKQLLDAGADIEAGNAWGYTPLFLAVMNGNTGPAYRLIEAGADITVRDRSLRTLLHYAARKNKPVLLEDLIFRGLNPNVSDDSNRIPLLDAIELELVNICRLLIKHNADVNCVGRYSIERKMGWVTPVQKAIEKGSLALLRMLVVAGACVQDLKNAVNQGNLPDKLLENILFFDWIVEVINYPSCLQDLCRIKVRQSLGQRVSFVIPDMTLPSSIKQILALDELNDVND